MNSDVDISEQEIKEDYDDVNGYPQEENEDPPEEKKDPPEENDDLLTNEDIKIPPLIKRRTRIAKSVVYEYFYEVKIFHPVTKKPVLGAICRHCKEKYASRISTNLKRHLKTYHPEAFKEVESKFLSHFQLR